MTSRPKYAKGSIAHQSFLQRQDLFGTWTDLCSTIDSFLSISVQPHRPEWQNSAEQMH